LNPPQFLLAARKLPKLNPIFVFNPTFRKSRLAMILLPLMIWYARREEPIRLADLTRGLAILLLVLFILPGGQSTTAEEPSQFANPQLDPDRLLLREGTPVRPIVGRVVMVGRRWAFVPAPDQTVADTVGYRSGATALPVSLEQITLQENLMLQRIVEAIQADATDDHWIVAGEITEFFNENQLLIRIAQRANRR
jgi:hypothetical protein